MTHFIFALFWNYTSRGANNSVNVMANGQYLIGKLGDVFYEVTVRFYYYD